MRTRLNKYIAASTGISRRKADEAIANGLVTINGATATLGQLVDEKDIVKLSGKHLKIQRIMTVLVNKPIGYVCSRTGQGSKTIYDLLPSELHSLKPVGRLDKDSSGLILLTNDGELANQLSHPRYSKTKIYLIELDKPLQPLNQQMISDIGVSLNDGPSKLGLVRVNHERTKWQISMSEGRNRQIRRTFEALGYKIISLHRTNFGPYKLDGLKTGAYQSVTTEV